MSEVDWQGGLVWRFGLPASKSRVADLEDGLPGFGYVGDRITAISRFPKIGTQQPLVFLLKITTLGCFGGTTILGSPPFISELPPLRRGPTFARSFRGPYILIYIFLNHVRCLIPPNTWYLKRFGILTFQSCITIWEKRKGVPLRWKKCLMRIYTHEV